MCSAAIAPFLSRTLPSLVPRRSATIVRSHPNRRHPAASMPSRTPSNSSSIKTTARMVEILALK